MTGVHIVSLLFLEDQEVPPHTWWTVRFPYDSLESGDPWGMHEPVQPDGTGLAVTDWYDDERSGLIWPCVRGWASFTAKFAWRAGEYTEIRDQFIRDPFRAPNATGLEHRVPSIGVQYFSKHDEFAVKPGQPVAVQVYHNNPTPLMLADGQFKMAIHQTEEPA